LPVYMGGKCWIKVRAVPSTVIVTVFSPGAVVTVAGHCQAPPEPLLPPIPASPPAEPLLPLLPPVPASFVEPPLPFFGAVLVTPLLPPVPALLTATAPALLDDPLLPPIPFFPSETLLPAAPTTALIEPLLPLVSAFLLESLQLEQLIASTVLIAARTGMGLNVTDPRARMESFIAESSLMRGCIWG